MKNEEIKIKNQQDDDKKKKRLIFIIIGVVIAVALAIVLPLTLTKCSTTKYTYGNPIYTWATDYSTCTAERVANEDPNHKETETVNSTYQVVNPAKCEVDGTGRYTATFTNEAFETQTNDVTITAIGHTYGNPTYTWSSDYSSCTAERVCLNDNTHKETETKTSTSNVISEPDCVNTGLRKYDVAFENAAFTAQSHNETIPALGHDLIHHNGQDATCTESGWAEYDTCSRCDYSSYQVIPAKGHTAGTPVQENVVSATCNEDGSYESVTYCVDDGVELSRENKVIPALGHAYGTPTYEWSADHLECTATRICARDNSHVETETVSSTYQVAESAKCVEDGTGRYTATFTNAAFTTQTSDISLPATGHDWGTPTYEWSADNTKCTATRVCSHDASHIDTETVNSTYQVVVAAQCDVDGTGRYTVNFTKTAFTTQVKDVTITATGHDWGTPTYEWSSDNSTCTAKRICTHNSSHIDTETKASTCTVIVAGDCTNEGTSKFDVTFENAAFEAQSKTVTIPGEHDWGTPTYEWSSDNSTCTATVVCSRDATHVDTETVNTTSNTSVSGFDDPTIEATITAEFTDPAFEDQTKAVSEKYHGQLPVTNDTETLIKYGLYPQTNVNDPDLVTTLDGLTTPESNGWYLYDNEYYAKCNATPNKSSYKFDNGTTIVSDTTYWFKCEPITWNVLSNNDGEYYILSSVLLDVHCYYNSTSNRTIDGKTIYPNNYEYSDIRTWLNNDFYNSAFELGDSYIQTTTVDNSAATTNPASSSYACNNTQDKVFLPSYQDYINSTYGFSTLTGSTDTRYCKTTDWARARGSNCGTSSSNPYNAWYWTRSPSSANTYSAWGIRYDGYIYGDFVHSTFSCVRPTLIITMA